MARPADMPSFKTVGERIAWWRKRRGLSRSALAKKLRMPYSTLAGIEGGDQRSSTKLPAIAAALQINVLYLATDEGDPEEVNVVRELLAADEWPFSFSRAEFEELDPNERELASMKLERIISEIKSKRPKARAKKAG